MRSGVVPAVRTTGLGKRYGKLWALQECSIEVPQGRVSALVGPNGAGKTTLLKILAGLSAPSSGDAYVMGGIPGSDAAFLDSIGYLAQDIPLYRRLTAAEHVALCEQLNPIWDATGAHARLRALRVPMDRPVSTFSGGQRAALALTLAIAKRPQVLLLDEPVAALDPLVRRTFLTALAEAVADGGLTAVMSSHLLHDLERISDHLILLSAARTQLCGDIDDIVSNHRMLVGPRRKLPAARPGFEIVRATQTERQTRLLVRTDAPVVDPEWNVTEVGLEDVVLAYMGVEEDKISSGSLSSVGSER
ncbi:MAG TPA: ABC transporter ATP-binding protein [Actinomycetota bacterium]|nr:ABC transporter ATP-binding protein [Actinomycetota bacterium]